METETPPRSPPNQAALPRPELLSRVASRPQARAGSDGAAAAVPFQALLDGLAGRAQELGRVAQGLDGPRGALRGRRDRARLARGTPCPCANNCSRPYRETLQRRRERTRATVNAKTKTRERAVSLMENVLRGGAEIEPEYPLVFGAAATGDVVAVEEEGDVRSACTTLVRDFLVDGHTLRGGLIGSVSTDPAYRRRGLATRVLLDAEEQLLREGCHFALLWADEPAFYQARGWRPMGVEIDYSIPAAMRSQLPRHDSVRVAQDGDAAAIHGLYVTHGQRVDRSPAETELLLAVTGVEVLVAESAGQMVGYACMGRGEDLRHVVHEWAGSSEVVLALVRSHMEREMLRKEHGDVFLMTPR